MAITATHKETSGSATNATSYVTGSNSSTNGALLVLFIYSHTLSGGVNIPPSSVTSTHGTWAIKENQYIGSPAVLSAFWTIANGNTGAITMSWGSTTQRHGLWSLSEFGNIYTDDPIVQTADDTATSDTPSTTLNSFLDLLDATVGAVANQGSATATEGSGFAELGETADIEGVLLESQWRNDNSTTVDWALSGSATWAAIGLELREATVIANNMLAVSD
jgi:hypothetical protein